MTDDGQWYAVRCIFRQRFLEDLERADSSIYEERITLWRARSDDHAIELAEVEASEYAELLEAGVEYLGLAQSYRLADDPGHGSEVFSLLRESELDSEAYLDTFFRHWDRASAPHIGAVPGRFRGTPGSKVARANGRHRPEATSGNESRSEGRSVQALLAGTGAALHPTSHGKHVVLAVSAVTAEGADGDEVSGGGQPAELTEREAEGLRRFGWS